MDINEFADLIERCKMSVDKQGKMTFTPRYHKDERRVAEIIKNNKMEHFSFTDLQAISKNFAPLYQARRKLQSFQPSRNLIIWKRCSLNGKNRTNC